jgi:hypothetical protein
MALHRTEPHSVLQVSPNVSQVTVINAFASAATRKAEVFDRYAIFPFRARKLPDNPNRQTDLNPKQIKQAYNDLVVQ